MDDGLESIRNDLNLIVERLSPETVPWTMDVLDSIASYLAGYQEHKERQGRLNERLKIIKEKMDEVTDSSTT